MLNTPRSRRGMVTSPHHLASEAGVRVLREGGNAIEAAVAMAANLAVVYPHMTSIGGDGFWLIAPSGRRSIGVDACGGAAKAATARTYASLGHATIPQRGPLAANTVAGTLSGWAEALAISGELGGSLPLSRLVEDAVWSGENGFAVTASQQDLTETKLPELRDSPNFTATFLLNGKLPREGELMKLPALQWTSIRASSRGKLLPTSRVARRRSQQTTSPPIARSGANRCRSASAGWNCSISRRRHRDCHP
jgi:oxamate amidohydrolase